MVSKVLAMFYSLYCPLLHYAIYYTYFAAIDHRKHRMKSMPPIFCVDYFLLKTWMTSNTMDQYKNISNVVGPLLKSY